MAPTSLERTWRRGDYEITTETARFDIAAIHAFLTESYWSPGIPLQVVAGAIEGSLGFGLFHGRDQVGFARVVSDYATFAYLADVYVLDQHRGHGLGKWLVDCVVSHPDLQGLRRWMLATADAHGLYKHYGFTPLADPPIFMERHDPDVYRR